MLKVQNQPSNIPTLAPKVLGAPVNQQKKLSVAPPKLQPTLKVSSLPTPPKLSVTSKPNNVPTLNVPKPEGMNSNTGSSLDENRRSQLDDIVSQMVANQEKDEDIQFVVDDFKSKYGQAQFTQPESKGVGGVAGFGVGALKGLGNTARGVSKLFGKISDIIPDSIEKPVNTFLGRTPIGAAFKTVKGIEPTASRIEENKGMEQGELTKPTNKSQKAGFVTEQIGEFFVPAGGSSKLIGAIGKQTAKLPKLARGVANLGTRATVEGTSTAGVTALQGGSSKDVKNSAIAGGLFGLASKGIDSALKGMSSTGWSSLLRRTPTEAAKNKMLPVQAGKTGLFGLSRESIRNKAASAIQDIELQMDDLLSTTTGKVNPLKVGSQLKELRKSYSEIPGEESAVQLIDEMYRNFVLGKKSMSPLEANQLKRIIYDLINNSYGKGLLEVPAKRDAQKAIARGLKQEIERIIPEVKGLNEKQAVYIQIRKALDKALARTEGKGIAGTGIGLGDIVLGGVGTGIGAANDNPLFGVGLILGRKTIESPAVLSGVSKLSNYFDSLSPTKRMLFYNALKGMTAEGVD